MTAWCIPTIASPPWWASKTSSSYTRPMPSWWCPARARRTCASSSTSSRQQKGRRRPTINGCTGPGAITSSSTWGSAFRSSALLSSRAASCHCRNIVTAPNTGWWCAVRPKSRSVTKSARCMKTNSVYIPIGRVHRMANKGKIPLELIEVQTGSYLGEDDIERLEDVYKRTTP